MVSVPADDVREDDAQEIITAPVAVRGGIDVQSCDGWTFGRPHKPRERIFVRPGVMHLCRMSEG